MGTSKPRLWVVWIAAALGAVAFFVGAVAVGNVVLAFFNGWFASGLVTVAALGTYERLTNP